MRCDCFVIFRVSSHRNAVYFQIVLNRIFDFLDFLGFSQSIFCHNGLDELLNARDKWLAPNGIILPDQCTLYVAAMKYKSNFNRSNFWQNVYQFTMQPITQAVATEPYLMRVKLSDVIWALNSILIEILIYLWFFSFLGSHKFVSNQAPELVHAAESWLPTIRCDISIGSNQIGPHSGVFHIFRCPIHA